MKIKTIQLAWLAAFLIGFGMSPKLYGHSGQIAAGGGGGGPVTLTKLQQESIGLQTDKADFHSIDTILLLNGSVKIDPDRHAHVTTRISGRVEQLFARVGDHVEKGQ